MIGALEGITIACTVLNLVVTVFIQLRIRGKL